MTPDEIKFLYELEEHHWWFQGMRRILAGLLDRHGTPAPARILDAGCGTGYTLSWLRRRWAASQIYGLDFSADALSYCRAREEPLLVRASVGDLPFPSNCFDLILTLDVLDSLPPPAAARPFAELARVLKEGGMIVVRVPAFQFLYSQHDRAVSTEHRFRAAELRARLEEQALNVERVTYANSFLFPVAVVWRWLTRSNRADLRSDVRPLPKSLQWLNMMLARLFTLEDTWLRYMPWRLPVGLSVIALARKPAKAL